MYDDPGARLEPAFSIKTSSDTMIVRGNYSCNHSLNVGERLSTKPGDNGFRVGLNFAHAERKGNLKYMMVGAELVYDRGPVLWQTEVFSTDEEAGLHGRLGYYLNPTRSI